MRHLQLKRSDIIYDNEKQALEAVKKQAKATYGDTTSTTARVMRDGEPILASYRDDNAPNKVADILALLIKKDDGTDALFYIDSQDILNKIGIKVDVDFNSLWLTKLDSGEKTPIVVEDGKTKTVISAINDIAQYIAKDNGKIEELLKKTITGLEDTDTIDFNVDSTEDGLKGKGNVKVSSDVEGNLLKVSGDTGLYVATSDIKDVAGAVDNIIKTTDHNLISKSNSANTFTVRYANKPDAIQQITYDSAMDSGLTTPNKIGGIAAGTKAQDLNGQSVSKILDMILFPEIFPTLGSPSVGVTPSGNSYEVGTTFPTFSVTTNRGQVTCPGQNEKYVLGEVTKTATYTGATHTTETEALPSTVGYGTIYVHGYAEFAQGDELKTSYGHTATKDVNGKPISENPHSETALTGGNSAVTGFYKYGGNMASIDTIEKAAGAMASNKGNNVVKNGATIYNSALIVDYKSKEASKAGGLVDGNGGYVLALPSIMNITIKDVLQFNSGSGSWDASVKGDWEVFTPTTEDSTKFPGTLTDAAGNTYPVTYFKHKADSTALDGTGAARVSFAFVW